MKTELSHFEALTYLACQCRSKDSPHNHFFDSKHSSPLDTIREIIEHTSQHIKNPIHAGIAHRSIQLIKENLTRQGNTPLSKIISLFNRIVSKPSTPNKHAETLAFLDAKQTELKQQHLLSELPSSHLEAFCQFMHEFPERFNKLPDAMKGGEALHLMHISQAIWDSANVQELPLEEQYKEYANLMEENFIGSHMLFEGKDLFDQTHQETHQGNFSIRGWLQQRVSSHYRYKTEKQHHIAGNLCPEILLHHGKVGIDNSGKVVLNKGKAAYWDDLSEEQRKNATPFEVTWLQHEAHTDGPDLLSLFLHRFIDFPIYYLLKKTSPERPQVAKCRSKKGRGVPDTNPVIIRKSKKLQETQAIHPAQVSRMWRIHPKYLNL